MPFSHMWRGCLAVLLLSLHCEALFPWPSPWTPSSPSRAAPFSRSHVLSAVLSWAGRGTGVGIARGLWPFVRSQEDGQSGEGVFLPTFNTAAALQRLFYAELTDCDNTTAVEAWNCVWCKAPAVPLVSPVHWLDSHSEETHGYVARLGNGSQDVVVAFRGSRNLKNWVDNVEFGKQDVQLPGAPKKAQVHSGFQKAYRSLRSQLRKALSEVHADSLCSKVQCRVHFIGHSLGGALATLAATDFVASHKKDTSPLPFSLAPLRLRGGQGASPAMVYGSLTTFGSPRVGNLEFAEWVGKLLGGVPAPGAVVSARLVYNNDLIPGLPPAILGYSHIPTGVWEGPGAAPGEPDQYVVCQDGDGSEDFKCGKHIPRSLEDHVHYMQQNLGRC
eukprot:RCo021188